MHQGTFSHSLRLLEMDSGAGKMWGLGLGVALLSAWGVWFFLAEMTLYERSVTSKLEVRGAALPVQALVAGRVVEAHVTLGRQVHAGEVLVELDSAPLRLQLAEEEAHLQALQGQVSALREELAAETAAAQEERQMLKLASRSAQVDAERAALLAGVAEQELQRISGLRSKGLAASAEEERAQAEAQRTKALLEMQRLGAEHAQSQVRAQGGSQQARLSRMKRELAVLEGEMEIRRSTAERLRYEIDQRRLRAPREGVLGEVMPIRPGQVLREGEMVASVVPGGELEVVAQFYPEDAVGRVQPGQSARVLLDGFPWTQYGGLPATVSAVADEVRDGHIRVELRLDPLDRSPIPRRHGLPGTVEIEVEHISPAMLVLRAVGRRLAPPALGEDF
jgi:multidrug resistance efflux pump